MPRHLLDEFARFEVETSPAPSMRGRGTAYADFWTGMDFAIGTVRQAAGTTACSAGLGDITQSTAVAGITRRGFLRYVAPGGNVEDYPMAIVDTGDHKTFEAEFTSAEDGAFTGMSGGFFFAQGLPVGMAIQSPDGAKRLTFIRIEEIAFATQRWLQGRARNVLLVEDTDAPALPEGQLPLTLLAYDTPSVSNDVSAEALATGSGQYQFAFTKPTAITFGVGDGAAVGVSRVRVISDGPGAKPLELRVTIDASANGNNPQRFFKGEMSPDGSFDTGVRAERFARRVTITILSVQGDGPVRIDRVEIY